MESDRDLPEKLAIRQVDFLVKSHLLSAMALHPLLAELGNDAEKQALRSFESYGRRALYGTLEETIGTRYYWNQSPLTSK